MKSEVEAPSSTLVLVETTLADRLKMSCEHGMCSVLNKLQDSFIADTPLLDEGMLARFDAAMEDKEASEDLIKRPDKISQRKRVQDDEL